MPLKTYLISLFLFATTISSAQEISMLKGIATDKKGTPIIGCNVIIKGTKTGAVTDSCGRFTIPFKNDSQTIVFHSMSYVDLRAFEIELEKSEIVTEEVVFQLGNYKTENSKCPKVDKQLKKYIIP